MTCSNYYPLVSQTESNSINPCFIALLLIAVSSVSAIISVVLLYSMKCFVGSVYKQAFHYRVRCFAMVVYILSLALVLPSVENGLFFHSLILNLIVNVVFISPILVTEVLHSPIPSGVVLCSSLIEFITFAILTAQYFAHGESPFEKSDIAAIVQCTATLSSLILFISEFSFYKPSVELIKYCLENRMPIHLPNAISVFTFSHMNDMVERNFRNPNITQNDLHDLVPELHSDINYGLFNAAWTEQLKYKSKSLLRVIVKCFGSAIFFTFLFELLYMVLGYTQPQLFRILIQSIDDNTKTFMAKFIICVSMFLCTALRTLFFNASLYGGAVNAFSIKSASMRLLYNKAMKLSPESKNLKSTGDIISMISVDTDIVSGTFAYSIIYAFTLPLDIIFGLSSLYFLLGNSMWVGLIIMIVVIPINSKIMDSMRFLQARHLARRDVRTSLVSDILTSIKSIKMYSWEEIMLKKLDKARNEDELGDLVKKQYYSSMAKFISNCVPYLICGSSFYFYGVYSETPLTAGVMFPAITVFNMLQEPITYLPDVIGGVMESIVALQRVQEFLLLDEIEQKSALDPCTVGLEIKNAKFLWSKKDCTVALDNINYSVSEGKLSCIVGKVGSGKTAFLKSILGELPILSCDAVKPATLNICGSIAYCSQVPWIMNATVKQNILFNHEFDEAFYNLVLECCDLSRDILTFEEADNTFVGENGISLSGGQKARLSLARALYSRADIYILDDILSAVDAHVSAKLIAKVFNRSGGLLSGKTIILATNNVKILSSADEIVFLEDNTILEKGSFDEVVASDKKLADLINTFGSTIDDSDLKQYGSLEDIQIPRPILETYDNEIILKRLTNSNNTERAEISKFGRVSWSVYIEYAKACGIWTILLSLSVVILAAFMGFVDSYWLKHWADVNLKFGENVAVHYFIGIYLGIAMAIALLSCFREVCFKAIMSIKAAKLLHHNMAQAIIRAPMQFFESTPMGRILNRFTGDINSIDNQLSGIFNQLIGNSLSIIVTIIVISVNLPIFLLFFILLSFIYSYYQSYYVSIARDIKRLSSISTSPVVSVIGESISGDETIRAFNQASRFDYFVSLVLDNHTRTDYNSNTFARWIQVRLEFVGALVVLIVSTLSVLTQMSSRPLGAALIALIMSYTLTITESLERTVRMAANCESQIVSVERVLEYSNLPSEAPLIIENARTSPGWPSEGNIEFVNYSTSYREGLRPVLKNLNFKINSLEKIGIVGRTGAGKSSLAAAIFRLIEPTCGFIKIDNLVTSDIGLYDLRHNLNIIPQDAQALQGTVRSNLDPLQQYTDAQMMKALELSHFGNMLKQENILDYAISEGGSNLSVGQRQLLCLSRALLNPSKILILDEATAAVDVETDKIIQETIRKEFNDRTIITIAHRLDTILDYDKVLLLDEGEVKEFDRIDVLLKNKHSMFYKMCEAGGYL